MSVSAEETSLLLSRFGVQLSAQDLAVVQRRSEGWVAGLQMAAISMQRTSDIGRVADRVGLTRHTVVGYFLDEVLYRQPDVVVQFMLSSSVLDELSESACAAVCGLGATELLQRVYRDHLFVSMVDDAAGTYRYHQLIREVLQAELYAHDPERARQLHQLAAHYLADLGGVGSAARHLLDAGDASTAFQLLSDGVLNDYGTNPALGSAMDDIQPEDFAGHPEILVPLAAELLLRGDFGRGAGAFELAIATGVDAITDPDLAIRLAVVGAMYHHFRGEEVEALAFRDLAHGIRGGAGTELLSVESFDP